MANTIRGISGVGAPCAGCSFNRKACSPTCNYARIFRVRNVANVLQDLPESQYIEAITSYLFQATERIENPIGGCAARLASFEQKVEELQSRVTALEAKLSGGSFRINPCNPAENLSTAVNISEQGALPTEVGLLANLTLPTVDLLEHGASSSEKVMPAYPAPYLTISDYQAALNSFQSRSSRFSEAGTSQIGTAVETSDSRSSDWANLENIEHNFSKMSSFSIDDVLNFDADDLQILRSSGF